MNLEPYKEWINLYTNEVEEIWQSEKKELRRPAMIMKILEIEFKRVQNDLTLQMSKYREQYETLEKHTRQNVNSIVDRESLDVNSVLCSPGFPRIEEKDNICDDSLDMINIDSSPLLVENVSEITIPNTSDDSVHTSPKMNKRKKYFSKRKQKFNSLDCTISKSIEKKKSPVELVNVTPKPEDDDLINCTVIDSTPVINRNVKKARTLLEISKKRNLSRFKKSSNNNSTLTQMFGNISSDKAKLALKSVSDDQTDDTFCPNANQGFSDDENEPISNKGIDGEKPRREVICKEPVVRGKARQKLEGWDCEECKKFYEVVGVNTPERKRLQNQCSKHRGNRKRVDYTPPGFWSINFPPTQNTEPSSTSMYFQY